MNQIGHIKHNTPPKTEKGFLIYKCNKDTERNKNYEKTLVINCVAFPIKYKDIPIIKIHFQIVTFI